MFPETTIDFISFKCLNPDEYHENAKRLAGYSIVNMIMDSGGPYIHTPLTAIIYHSSMAILVMALIENIDHDSIVQVPNMFLDKISCQMQKDTGRLYFLGNSTTNEMLIPITTGRIFARTELILSCLNQASSLDQSALIATLNQRIGTAAKSIDRFIPGLSNGFQDISSKITNCLHKHGTH